MYSIRPGYRRPGLPGGVPAEYGTPLRLYPVLHFRAPGRPPEGHSRRLFVCQGLFRALGYEVSLYLGRQPEGESDDLGVDVVGEFEVVLDGADPDSFRGAGVEDAHHHEHVPAEPGNLGADEGVAPVHSAEKVSKFPFLGRKRPGFALFDPFVDADSVRFRPS